MCIMKSREELIDSIKNNRNLLEEENRILYLSEEKITEKIINENKKIIAYNNNKKEYTILKKSEIKQALINLLEITSIGLTIFLITSFIDNNIYTINQMFNSMQAVISLIFIGFGDSVILIDTFSLLKDYKKNNIDIYNIEEIDNNRNKYYNDLNKIKGDISLINEKLNTYDRRINELTKKEKEVNIYENIEEKPIQKKKI